MQVYGYDPAKCTIYENTWGNYTICYLQTGVVNVQVWPRGTKIISTTADETVVYTGSVIDTSQRMKPGDIVAWIRKNKKYKNTSQQGFHTGDSNAYFENIYKADECDCLPANSFFVAMCRSLWYPARFHIWYKAYTKQWKTYISKNQWHAYAEVFINGQRKIYDATPCRSDTDDQNNEWNSIEEMLEEWTDWDWKFDQWDDDWDWLNQQKSSQEKFWEWSELKKKIWVTQWMVMNIVKPDIDSPYFDSARKYVYADAVEIITYVRSLLKERDTQKKRTSMLWGKNKKWRHEQSSGDLRINFSSIQKLAVGDSRIFMRKKKISSHYDFTIDTLLSDVSLAVDISWSMWFVTGNRENWSKADHAYLTLVLLFILSQELDITFDEAILFGSHVVKWTVQDILQSFHTHNGWWNNANTIGIYTALQCIEHAKKWVCFILSDWDWATWTYFFDEQWKIILQKNKHIITLWYWLWEDATQTIWVFQWAEQSVIQSRMYENDCPQQSRGYNVKEYSNLVPVLKKHILMLMTQENMRLID